MKKPTKGKVVATETLVSVTDNNTTNSKSGQFPIIGIGASAGGLEALEQFFKNMPKDSGMAFVVIQHLDPKRKGILPELLQRFTQMKVVAVTDRLKINPNWVYVIPSNKSLSVLNGFLYLFKPLETRGLRLPIDFFFRSLADDQQQQSVGIILSGMGADGSLGLKAIKEKGGIALVQEPKSAQFDSMPRNAIKAATPDFIESPSALPNKLLHIHERGLPKSDTVISKKDSAALQKIIILIRDQTGNDFSEYKENTIYRRIDRRMRIHQISNMGAYVRYLQENPLEIEILFKELLIGVTSFFRDAAVWEHLKDKVFPKMFAGLEDGHILRAWVPACSTGEEAFTLAIIFKEALEKAKLDKNISLNIFATDLDSGSIEEARNGLYPNNITTDVSASRLSRFFIKTDKTYKVNAKIREMVIFAEQNIIKDPPFTKLDILSCRNMLIYMGRDLQKNLMLLFHYSLNKKGILLLGSAETYGDSKDLFTIVHAKHHIYQSIDAKKTHVLSNFPSSFVHSKNNITENIALNKMPDTIQTLTDNLLLQKFSPASALVTKEGDILYLTGSIGKYLTPVAGKASMNLFTMARVGLQEKLPGAFGKATKNYDQVVLHKVKIGTNGGSIVVDVTLQQIETPTALKGRIMVLFTDVPFDKQKTTSSKKTKAGTPTALQTESEEEIHRLNEELQTTREEMQTSHEELKSTNEELQSSNEEMQSTNEELTTSKEEMQSLNEELNSLNAELQSKIEYSEQNESDMNNLLNSSEIATLFLDKKFKIRQYTAHITKIFKLIPTDIGRDFTDLKNSLNYPEILDDAKEVLRTLVFSEKTISTIDGHYFNVRIMPYRTLDDRIDGLVLTFIDITKANLLETKLLKTKKQYEELFNSMVEMFQVIELIYDSNGKAYDYYYRDVNPAFEKLVGKTKKQLLNKRAKSVFKIVEDYWIDTYEKVLKKGKPVTFENYGAELDKYYKVTAWKASENRVAITFTDITESKLSENVLSETQDILKSLINKVPSVVLALSSTGEVIEFNPEAEKVFGRNRAEVLGKNYFDLFIANALRKKVKSDMKQLLSGSLPNHFENIVKSAKGAELKIEWTAHKLFNEKGDFAGIITIGENITPL